MAVITRGAEGSVVVTKDETVIVPAAPVHEVLDTTGAGDLFASGFLHGYLRGWSHEQCAKLGAKCAAEVIQHIGARTMKPLSGLLGGAAA
jgi:sugar/nucleoside kinase (ribokinase family)